MKFIIECIKHNGGNSLFEAMVYQEKDFRHSFDISKKNTLYSIQYKDDEIDEATDTNINAKFEELSSGGVITFSTDVNSVTLSNDRFKNYLKQKFVTYCNRLKKNSMLDKIRRKHEVLAWNVGRYIDGVYTGKNGKTYSENSLSITLRGLKIDDIIEIAKDICKVFTQESVMVDDCEKNITYIIYAKK